VTADTRAPSPPYRIREVLPAEHAALGALTVQAYRDAGETDGPYYLELADVAGRAAQVPVLVAVEAGSGRLLGGVTYVPGAGALHEGEPEGHASVRMLAVRAEARGRGVATALMRACIERARREGRSGLSLFTRPFMHPAHRLYEGLGFERDPARDWEYEPGEWLLAYRLAPLPGDAAIGDAGPAEA
jgi:ribosomal protein S18 acetylase RimI-like enzyme